MGDLAVVFQVEALDKLWRGNAGQVSMLAEVIANQGIRAWFVAYGRTDKEIRKARGLVKSNQLLIITERTAKVALLYALSSSGALNSAGGRRALLFCDSRDDAMRSAAGRMNVELIACTPGNAGGLSSPTSLLQRIFSSYLKSREEGGSRDGAERVVVVGYIMRPSRESSLSRQGLLHLKAINGVSFVPVDHATPFDLQQRRCKFDLLMHKASDWIVLGSSGLDVTVSLPSVFDSLAGAKIPWLDSIERTSALWSRTEMHKLLMGLGDPDLGLSDRLIVPATIPFGGAGRDFKGKVPLIVKSNAACGVSFSHKMIIVRTEEPVDLDPALESCYNEYRDLVVQDYIDHDGHETKVYCIGDAIHVSKRRLGTLDKGEDPGPITVFDSLEAKSRSPGDPGGGYYPVSEEDRAILCECGKWLRNKLGVHLFGFDALKARGSGKIAIIDVNYFPSFKGIPEARSDLHRVITSQLS
ncbi:inositol-tetrakisphosphate 1-kinase [Chloropicon primus]|uniref:inositol-1,3,4-trisphosphate 5/6-kinase n=1 Tax=Chloropicon primus TaxID=1764295 RepID=A0A5B8MGY0_9CHLO|nr:inositol-tetrakisphosphate 1-kinase [Chloropicon primus]UPQ97819.1 inositol-tetrakisphosphate 1-kinase [Chloropicon primus]|mmetsp:Transcript_3166/g.8760  ORF Transcript_3166/g.8760 Transcript_3166/m.8760 type:complete len:470 (-) Transcript_3166:1076-2485(-)|eukprot:QDZ18610.1 inositol-tetrakisphosphate 1-kinase [Chloropicon primus]